MKPQPFHLLCFLLVSVYLAGCTGIQSLWNHHFNVNGAISTVSNRQDRFSQVDLVSALTPDARPPACGVAGADDSSTSQACLAAAFAKFYQIDWDKRFHPDASPTANPSNEPVATGAAACSAYSDRHLRAIERARNAIQDRLVAASELACSEFEQQLNTFQSNSNFLLGVLSIASGGAGAIVTSTTAARALAGSAAGVSGVRAEWNTDLFAKLLVSTLTKAINTKRDEWLTTLRGSCVSDSGESVPVSTSNNRPVSTATPASTTSTGGKMVSRLSTGGAEEAVTFPSDESSTGSGTGGSEGKTFKIGRQQLSIDVYSIEAAVGDALVYNDLCSLDRGLEFVNASVDTAANPGLDAMKSYLDKLKAVNQSLQNALKTTASPTTGPATKSSAPTKPTSTKTKR